ncbi:MAG: SDR family NAD(P)-dependent oxidoreductase [Legionellales bacterium]|nr:SDR family NAD(P)-dependent oxidoreductase [Legionellales bacterium]
MYAMVNVMNSIVVTGSSSGIGRAITEYCLPDYQVVGLARRQPTVLTEHPHYQAVVIDFAQLESLAVTLASLTTELPPPAAIICSAGYGQFGGIEQFSLAQMQRLMNVNFLSQAVVVKAFLPKMKRAGCGKIIFIGSEAALAGEKQGGLYCASKFALRGLSQSLRKECANSGLSVTLINPGMTDTDFFAELTFAPKDTRVHALQPKHIVDAVAAVLAADAHCVWEEINLQPITKAVVKRKKTTAVDCDKRD